MISYGQLIYNNIIVVVVVVIIIIIIIQNINIITIIYKTIIHIFIYVKSHLLV